jgi:hypothetical protein
MSYAYLIGAGVGVGFFVTFFVLVVVVRFGGV